MGPPMIKMTRIYALMILALAMPVQLSAADVLARFIGAWTGEGTVRLNIFDDPQKIRCQVVGAVMLEHQISFSGKCATVNGAGAFEMLLAQDPTGARFAAKIRVADDAQAIAFTGQSSASGIEFLQVSPQKRGDQILSAKLDVTFDKDGSIHLQNLVADQKTDRESLALSVIFQSSD